MKTFEFNGNLLRGDTALRTIHRLVAVVLLAGLCLIVVGRPGFVSAQALSHTVEQGDTLWNICEKYYGDAGAWPKLWEMNQFVTNPHLLRAGDVINLFEKFESSPDPAESMKEVKVAASNVEESPVGDKGVDISGMTNVEAMGFFSTSKIESWGSVTPGEGNRVLYSANDTVQLAVEGERSVTLGDTFYVCAAEPLGLDAFSKKILGYTVSVRGKVVITEEIDKSIYKGEVTRAYKGIEVGNKIIPYKPLSSCIKPEAPKEPVNAEVIAVKDRFSMIGLYSVVYLNKGYNHGVLRGNLLELIVEKKTSSFSQWEDISGAVAYLLIVEARPDTATGIIVSIHRETLKDTVSARSLDWTKAQSILSNIPECSLD